MLISLNLQSYLRQNSSTSVQGGVFPISILIQAELGLLLSTYYDVVQSRVRADLDVKPISRILLAVVAL